MIQTWSRESTERPIVEPNTQWSGSGLGQNGSTSNRGATPAAPNSAAGAAAAGGAAGEPEVCVGGAALSQAASSAPVPRTRRVPARRVMVPPIRQRCRAEQGLFLPRIIAEIGATYRGQRGLIGAAAGSVRCADRRVLVAARTRARGPERRHRAHARAARRRSR